MKVSRGLVVLAFPHDWNLRFHVECVGFGCPMLLGLECPMLLGFECPMLLGFECPQVVGI